MLRPVKNESLSTYAEAQRRGVYETGWRLFESEYCSLQIPYARNPDILTGLFMNCETCFPVKLEVPTFISFRGTVKLAGQSCQINKNKHNYKITNYKIK